MNNYRVDSLKHLIREPDEIGLLPLVEDYPLSPYVTVTELLESL
jgi:hypothetical protein